jgi:hypothetical protein
MDDARGDDRGRVIEANWETDPVAGKESDGVAVGGVDRRLTVLMGEFPEVETRGLQNQPRERDKMKYL